MAASFRALTRLENSVVDILCRYHVVFNSLVLLYSTSRIFTICWPVLEAKHSIQILHINANTPDNAAK